MDDVARQPARERADLFTEAGARRGLLPAILEKDFWVCWTLKRLFSLPGDKNPSLVFKGGTSLSKIYGVIRRFSEDIDLSFDRKDLGYSGDRDPQSAPSKKQAEKLVGALDADVQSHIVTALVPRLDDLFAAELPKGEGGWSLTMDKNDPRTVLFQYPPSLPAGGPTYVKRFVRLELGARGDPWPTEQGSLQPYVAEEFPEFFKVPNCRVTVLASERTFWEKATILHAEYHRPPENPAKERQARHYYDLALLASSEHGQRAMGRLDLLEKVVAHKKVYFAAGWAKYDSAKPGSLRLVPHKDRLDALHTDYAAMREMIFDEPPRFEDILARIAEAERRINGGAVTKSE